MIFKKGLATLLVLVSMVGPSQMASPSSGRQQQQQRGAVAIPAAAAAAVVLPKKDGPNFDQQRLIALFGSEAQPVYGNRDPTTGRVVLAPSDPSNTGGSRPVYVPPPARNNQEAITAQSAGADADADVDPDQTPAEEVDRKDTRVPETNEINPFELLPPQFHDLLNIPIHDYGNGTTYNPYDKYKVPSKSKYPLVSTGYANTKYQGSPNRSTIKPVKSAIQTPIKPAVATYDYDYQTDDFAPVKTNNQRPDKAKIISTTTTRTTTTATYDDQFDDQDDYSDHYPTTKKQRIPARQPETVAAVYRPNKHQIENTRKPVRPYDIDDDNNSQSDGGNIYRDQISTYRPAVVENRPGPETRPNYNSNNKRPEYRPSDNKQQQENRPAIRPSYPDYQDGQESDDWPKRPSVNRPDGFSPYKPINRPRPTTYDDHDNQQPSKPSYSSDDESLSPVFTPHQSYRPQSDDQIAEIKVTPKPFYAADDNQNYNQQQQQQQQPQVKTPGQVDDEPDIIYDYDDERSKGEGVMFMFDNGPSPVAAGPDKPSSASKPATASPPASPYPTVASRDPRPQPPFNPAFRPSAPVRPSSEGSFLSSPPSPQQQQQPGLPIRNPSPQLPQQQKQQQQQPQFGNSEAPRPPFRFPADPVNPKENQQPPNILPLFRPNTNPTDEFQFIKHPQQIEFQRQQPNPSSQFPPGGQLPKRPVPAGQEIRQQQQQQRPGGMSPLPSALQTPFSSISQAVANFFGRRSGQAQSAGNNQRSGDLNPSVKMDRSGIMDPTETESEFDLEMAESQNSGSFVLFSRPDQPLLPSPVSVDRSGLSIQHPTAQQTPVAPAAAHPQVVGIRAAPDAASGKPPAFYVYTSRELEQGKPPYLVVGPVRSGPPNVAGAQLVHTAPAKPIPATPESQRRNDFPSGEPNSNRPPNLNSLPTFPVAQDPSSDNIPSARQPPEVVAPVRKPFFPISSGNKNERLPTGLSPPRQGPPPPLPSNNRRPPPGFIFPEIPLETEPVLPQGISPISQGIPPPRVPLNPQKDVASLFSNPTLLHNRPSEPFNSGSSFPIHPPIQKVTDQGLAIKNQPDPSVGVASIQNVNLYEETSTLRPLKRKTTKSPSRTTTTPIYMEAFNNKQPVTYATIQQEDGKQIAVVHPAYIVTYKSQPGPPELIDLDAPFVPSIESPTSQGELSSIPFEKWHAMPQEIKRQDDQITQQSSKKETNASPASSSSSNTELHSGFLPVVPDRK